MSVQFASCPLETKFFRVTFKTESCPYESDCFSRGFGGGGGEEAPVALVSGAEMKGYKFWVLAKYKFPSVTFRRQSIHFNAKHYF